jgi:hypothetical protein
MRNDIDGVNHGKKSKERNVAIIRLVQGMQDNDHDPYIAGNLSMVYHKHVANNLIIFEFKQIPGTHYLRLYSQGFRTIPLGNSLAHSLSLFLERGILMNSNKIKCELMESS